MSKQSEHERGQRDGAAYKKQGAVERVVTPRYNPRGEPKERETYNKGHKNARK